MQDLDLDESIKAEWRNSSQRTKVSVYEVVQNNFEKIEYYRKKKYPLTVIFAGFKRSGLIDCGISHFRTCYYKCKKQGASFELRNRQDLDPYNALTKEGHSLDVGRSGLSSQDHEDAKDFFDPEAAIERVLGSSKTSEKEAEGAGEGERGSHSPIEPPSLMTKEMAARLERDKQLFKERLRSMGINRD